MICVFLHLHFSSLPDEVFPAFDSYPHIAVAVRECIRQSVPRSGSRNAGPPSNPKISRTLFDTKPCELIDTNLNAFNAHTRSPKMAWIGEWPVSSNQFGRVITPLENCLYLSTFSVPKYKLLQATIKKDSHY